MNPLLIIFGFIIITTTYAQKKKNIIKKIDNYMYKTVYYADYETDIDSFKSVIEQYFQQNNFKLTNESDSDLTFYTEAPAVPYSYTRETTKITRYTSYISYTPVFVTVTIYEKKSKKNISITANIYKYQMSSTRSSTLPVIGLYKFDELSLRKYLYINYYGKYIPFPDSLSNSINDYNALQAKEQKIIVKSKDYYIYTQK